jgi:hypothetical protein
MPYTIRERNGMYCVVKKDDPEGHSFGCHPTKERAVSQIGAIESSERENSVMFKEDANGQMWFVGTYSNQFKDRQNQIISEEAHLKYIEWLKETGVKPQITLYHMPRYAPGFWVAVMKAHEMGLINNNTLSGIMRDFYKDYAIAETEKVIYSNGFVIVVAKVYDNKKELVKQLQNVAGELGMSHGFVPGKYSDSIYDEYKSFEYSVLHRSRAANVYTDAKIFGGNELPMDAEEKALLNTISDGLGDEIEHSTEDKQNELRNKGTEFKENPPAEPEKENAEPEQTPAEPVAPEGEKTEENEVPNEAQKLINDLVLKVAEGINIDGLVATLNERLDGIRAEIKAGLDQMESRIKAVEETEDEKVARMIEPNWQKLIGVMTDKTPVPVEAKKEANPMRGWETLDSDKIFWGTAIK